MPEPNPITPATEQGPAVYLNWLAAEEQKPLLSTQEYPLYTDAHIVAQVQHGPYHFLNAVALPHGAVRPAVILRCDWHWEFPYPDWAKTDAERYHGGSPADEIAALASLALGVRFRAGDSTREFRPGGDPMGNPRASVRRAVPLLMVSTSSHRWIMPRVAQGQHSLELLHLLGVLPNLDSSAALSLVRSARLYQDALWLAESEPALAWLLLVSAIETAAQHWRAQEEEPIARFQIAKPELYEHLSKLEDSTVVRRVAEAFKDSFGATRKFVDFALRFRPPQPQERPGWGALDWSDKSVKKILETVYKYRSKALHAGRPFPAPMCEPPYHAPEWPAPTERPHGHVSMNGCVWREEDVPILLHTFEFIARGTLLNWWHAQAEKEQQIRVEGRVDNIDTADRKIASMNPATGEVLRQFDSASQSEVHAAVVRARNAQPAWQQLGVGKRIAILRNFLRLLHERKSEVARLITTEAGKPIVEALLTEVVVVLDAARFCIENAYLLLRDEPVPHRSLAMKTKSGHLAREPYGVIGIISPWNYPFSIPATETLAALVTGNTVVLKPSELTPQCALQLAELLHQSGVPIDVLQVVVGNGATGAALVNGKIDKLVFTGSVVTGRRIAQVAAARLLPVVLELGGKDPMIILDDANVDVASSAAVWGAFVNAGQACLSVERCYVHRSLYPRFLELVVQKTKQLRVGNGIDPQTDVGPLIHERQLKIVESHVADALSRGSRLLTGGGRLPHLGPNFYAPTLLADVTHAMLIMREETFGPVLPVMAFDSDEEAVRLANDSGYGLAASIWTRDRVRGEALARHIHAGTVMINDAISCFGISEAPHGGVKASGIGRTHGRFGLEEMARVKYVDSDGLPEMKKLWWYPYGATFNRQMEGFVDFMFAHSLNARLRGALRMTGALKPKGKL